MTRKKTQAGRTKVSERSGYRLVCVFAAGHSARQSREELEVHEMTMFANNFSSHVTTFPYDFVAEVSEAGELRIYRPMRKGE